MIDESVLWVRVMGDERQLTKAQTEVVVNQAVAVFLDHYLVRDGASTPAIKKPTAKQSASTKVAAASKKRPA